MWSYGMEMMKGAPEEIEGSPRCSCGEYADYYIEQQEEYFCEECMEELLFKWKI